MMRRIQGWAAGLSLAAIAATACAGPYDLKEITPAVKEALAGRQARYDTLTQLKAPGAVGEDNHGHVARLSGGDEVAGIVAAENADRETIYAAIVQQNGLPAASIDTVRQVFAETQRNRAAPGEKLQLPSGEWTTK